jgi:radical SAM protein with 4Fe4S-binding SPASM domain
MIPLLERIGRRPFQVVWELTLACNLNCLHCGSRAGRPRPGELTTDEGLALCRDLAALGTKRITLAGGEPTLREDWDTFAKALVDLGIRTNILTNGRTWSREHARRAVAAGLDSVGFSVDGCEATHDLIRRVPGQWRSLVEAIRITREEGANVSIVTQINRANLGELEAVHAELKRLGVRSWQVQLGNPSGNLADHRDLVLPPEAILDLVPRIAALRLKGGRPRIFVGDNIGYFGPWEQHLRDQGGPIPYWIGCRAGMTVLGIESDGGVKGCLSLPSGMNGVDRFVEGNLRERPLAEIWNDPASFAYNRTFDPERLAPGCRDCGYAEVCRGGCSWASFAHTGECRGSAYCYHLQERLGAAAASR